MIAASVDSEYSHLAWKKTPVEKGGIGNIQYPIVADITKGISRAYDVLIDDSVALRGLFLIDKEGVIRHAVINDDPLGRSIDEALRMVDALRSHDKHGNVCPADWKDGDEGMERTSEGVANYLAKYAR